MTTSSKVSPTDRCGVCETIREEHGDKNHEFNLDGQLLPIKKGEPPRQSAPQPKGSTPKVDDLQAANLGLRIIDRLVTKGIFDAVDLMYVLGNGYVPTGGSPSTSADQDSSK